LVAALYRPETQKGKWPRSYGDARWWLGEWDGTVADKLVSLGAKERSVVWVDVGPGYQVALRQGKRDFPGLVTYGVDVVNWGEELKANPERAKTYEKDLRKYLELGEENIFDDKYRPEMILQPMEEARLPEPADLITALSSLSFADDPLQSLANLYNQLKPEGVLLVDIKDGTLSLGPLSYPVETGNLLKPLVESLKSLEIDVGLVGGQLAIRRNKTGILHFNLKKINNSHRRPEGFIQARYEKTGFNKDLAELLPSSTNGSRRRPFLMSLVVGLLLLPSVSFAAKEMEIFAPFDVLGGFAAAILVLFVSKVLYDKWEDLYLIKFLGLRTFLRVYGKVPKTQEGPPKPLWQRILTFFSFTAIWVWANRYLPGAEEASMGMLFALTSSPLEAVRRDKTMDIEKDIAAQAAEALVLPGFTGLEQLVSLNDVVGSVRINREKQKERALGLARLLTEKDSSMASVLEGRWIQEWDKAMTDISKPEAKALVEKDLMEMAAKGIDPQTWISWKLARDVSHFAGLPRETRAAQFPEFMARGNAHLGLLHLLNGALIQPSADLFWLHQLPFVLEAASAETPEAVAAAVDQFSGLAPHYDAVIQNVHFRLGVKEVDAALAGEGDVLFRVSDNILSGKDLTPSEKTQLRLIAHAARRLSEDEDLKDRKKVHFLTRGAKDLPAISELCRALALRSGLNKKAFDSLSGASVVNAEDVPGFVVSFGDQVVMRAAALVESLGLKNAQELSIFALDLKNETWDRSGVESLVKLLISLEAGFVQRDLTAQEAEAVRRLNFLLIQA
jgi:SAM-dependent methyltransferase